MYSKLQLIAVNRSHHLLEPLFKANLDFLLHKPKRVGSKVALLSGVYCM